MSSWPASAGPLLPDTGASTNITSGRCRMSRACEVGQDPAASAGSGMTVVHPGSTGIRDDRGARGERIHPLAIDDTGRNASVLEGLASRPGCLGCTRPGQWLSLITCQHLTLSPERRQL